MSSPEPATRIAERLAAADATISFGVPGGGPNLDLIGAFAVAGIRFVLAHGETSAAIMAATFGHLTGTPAAVVVTRGPGATSVANGAAQATLDRHPLVVITDTVPAANAARVPHQRVDQAAFFSPIAKATARIGPDTGAAELDDLIHLACAEPPGAVHFDYDGTFAASGDDATTTTTTTTATATAATTLTATATTTSPTTAQTTAPVTKPQPVANRFETDPAAAEPHITQMINGAMRPVVIIGRAALGHTSAVRSMVERLGAPVLSTYQGIGVVPTEHRLNAGLFTNGASERPLLQQADLIITVGLDVVEPIPAPWTYSAPVLSLSPTPTVDPYMPIVLELTGSLDETLLLLPAGAHRWTEDTAAAHRGSVLNQLRSRQQGFAPTVLVDTLLKALPSNAITTVDAGAHFLAIMPFHPAAEPGDLLISNGLATMGYAVPAAIGASLANPERPVIALVGDGGLSMTLAELETIARLELPITVIVLNDSALSLIEVKQGPDHGGPAAVKYRPMDFATMAAGMGITGRVVKDKAQLQVALGEGFAGPRLIDARIDPSEYAHLIRVTRG